MSRRWLLLYEEKSVALQMVDQATGHDLRHDLTRVVDPFAALKAQREGGGGGDIFGVAGVSLSAGSVIARR